MTTEELENFVRNNWKCSHKGMIQDGWCGRCGCASKDYNFKVGCNYQITSALNGTVFECAGRIIWYKGALYELGLLTRQSIEETWQPVELADPKSLVITGAPGGTYAITTRKPSIWSAVKRVFCK